MKNILTVIKKELKVVFGNKRLMFSIILMPGILIFLMYTVMGKALQNRNSGDKAAYDLVVVEKLPDEFQSTLPENIKIEEIDKDMLTSYKQKVYDGDLDLIIKFPENVDDYFSSHDSFNVELYYNPSESTSDTAYQIVSNYLSAYNTQKMNEYYGNATAFTVNSGNTFELYNEDKANATGVAMLLPFLLISLLFSASMSVTPESIAGEKERGTLATLLVTQVKRSEIAIGKIVSLSILASLSGISSFIGTILSMPSLMGTGQLAYKATDYISILFVVLLTVILITGLLSIISAYAKSVKEASLLASPLMILSMVLGISSMFTENVPTNHFIYAIPLFNSVEALTSILSLEVNYVNIAITLVSNVVYTAILVYILSRMFNSEKIMFAK